MPRLLLASLLVALSQSTPQYGVDCSFPVQYPNIRCDHEFADNRTEFYERYMQGCRDHFGKKAKACDSYESDRLEMSLYQPQSMVNYSSTGFKKIKAPAAVYDLIKSHWELNKHQLDIKMANNDTENWGVGNIYTVSPKS
jgi:prolyl 4-hydroxylase